MFGALIFVIISGTLLAAMLVSPTRRRARMDRARRALNILVLLALIVLVMGLLSRIG